MKQQHQQQHTILKTAGRLTVTAPLAIVGLVLLVAGVPRRMGTGAGGPNSGLDRTE
jgi:hypothetical protein